MLRLYYARNTCALAPHLALEIARADYEAVRIDFQAVQQRSPEFLRINPKARVPALVTERGVLTEVPALLLFIAQRHPEAKLAPLDDPFALARAQAFNSYLCSTVHVAHAHRMRGYRWVEESDTGALEAMKRRVPQTVGECFQLIEREMLEGPWVMGEQYTICDLYLFTLSQWLEADGVDIEKTPKVAALRRRMSADPVVRKIIAAETSG
jgi:glutathione S-transferase